MSDVRVAEEWPWDLSALSSMTMSLIKAERVSGSAIVSLANPYV